MKQDLTYQSLTEYIKLKKRIRILFFVWLAAAIMFTCLYAIQASHHSFQWDTMPLLALLSLSGVYLFFYYLYQKKQCKEAYAIACAGKTYGISLENIQTDVPVNRFFLCFIRGILIFMASFGTITGLVTSFDLSFHWIGVTLGILIVSMLAAFLYYNKFTFYAGYLAIFILFTAFSISLYPYINSGFQGFINTVFQRYSDFFYLSSVREANEMIANRYLTISITMVFVGLIMAILLNITISGHMNLIETFLITFLPLQIALYIDRLPAIPYLAMLIAVYITVGILGRSGHYHMSLNMKKEPFFSRRLKKQTTQYSYQSSSRGILTLSIYSIAFCILFLLLCNSFFFQGLSSKKISNQLKNTTDSYVKILVQSGVWGFFDRYDSTGGLNNGMLGGAGSVNPDYQTDLEVTYVPYSTDTLYLKRYVGVHYNNNFFAPDDDLPQSIPMSGSLSDENFAKMEIRIVDPDVNMSHYPYDTIHASNEPIPGSLSEYSFMDKPETTLPFMESEAYTEAFQLWDDTLADYENPSTQEDAGSYEEYEVLYAPYQALISYPSNPAITDEYEAMVYENYLEVPEYLDEVMEDFCEEAGLNDILLNAGNAVTYEEQQQLRIRIAGTLKMYFAREFPYTMSPGATPRDRDAVEYFLTEQRRGFCAHFASSSTLLLRHMGIPTRYVEGYCIQFDDLTEATVVSNDISGWYIGDNTLSETGLVTVSVTDGSSHAWIEIYLDGYGWIPYEMTPPAFGDTIDEVGIMAIFSGLFTPVQRLAAGADNLTEGAGNFDFPAFSFMSSIDFVTKPLLILLAAVCLIILFGILRSPIRQQYLLSRALRQKDYSTAVILSYQKFVRRLQKKLLIADQHPVIRDVGTFLKQTVANDAKGSDAGIRPSIDSSFIDEWIRLTETAAYSPNPTTQSQYEQYRNFIKNLKF
ncbi:MAG: transglutaminase-like domain-containing protein [Lachnospiraceae bacterium]|nr:transglutaminase-like domain-containing protein [Lachnospiraceae bacterium]